MAPGSGSMMRACSCDVSNVIPYIPSVVFGRDSGGGRLVESGGVEVRSRETAKGRSGWAEGATASRSSDPLFLRFRVLAPFRSRTERHQRLNKWARIEDVEEIDAVTTLVPE